MDVFSAIVKLRSGAASGLFTGEVPKTDLSAAEVLLLQSMHGEDAVISIVKTGSDKRKTAAERDRLASVYGPMVVAKLFGAEKWKTLPQKLPTADTSAEDMAA